MTHWTVEGCRHLDLPYPEKYACIYCRGHGAVPRYNETPASIYTPIRCSHCRGTGRNDTK